MAETFLAAGTACSTCGYPIDATSSLEGDRAPVDGDLSICLACGDVGIFVVGAFGTTIREATPAEKDEARGSAVVRQVQAVRAVVVGDELRTGHP